MGQRLTSGRLMECTSRRNMLLFVQFDSGLYHDTTTAIRKKHIGAMPIKVSRYFSRRETSPRTLRERNLVRHIVGLAMFSRTLCLTVPTYCSQGTRRVQYVHTCTGFLGGCISFWGTGAARVLCCATTTQYTKWSRSRSQFSWIYSGGESVVLSGCYVSHICRT